MSKAHVLNIEISKLIVCYTNLMVNSIGLLEDDFIFV